MMVKKLATVDKIIRCGICALNGGGWCYHSDGWKRIPDDVDIPDWCPLPKWSDEDDKNE